MEGITIRKIREEDAQEYLDLCLRIDEETEFLLLEPGERSKDVEYQRQRIHQLLKRDNQMIFVAEAAAGLVGYLAVYGGGYRRSRHCGYLVAAMQESYYGRGIGTQMFLTMEQWARKAGLHRLELTVMAHNRGAVGLYKKMGFQIEGTKRDSLFINDQYVDEFYMAKLL